MAHRKEEKIIDDEKCNWVSVIAKTKYKKDNESSERSE